MPAYQKIINGKHFYEMFIQPWSKLYKRLLNMPYENEVTLIGQLATKVGGLEKKSAFQPHSNRSARVREHPGSNHSESLMAGNFAALQAIDLKFSALKDLKPFKTM